MELKALRSTAKFFQLARSGSIHLRRNRIGELYRVDRRRIYQIFRETASQDGARGRSASLIVGFHLRFIGSSTALHWIFRRICIISTPIWSGFPGFRVKLWMVDNESKDYLGIYEWAGADNAQAYVNWLVRLLQPFSTSGSVWYELFPNENITSYLNTHMVVSDLKHSMPQ